MTVHVGLVVTNFPPRVGGVEAHITALADHLVARGCVVTVVCLDDTAAGTVTDEQRDGVRVVTLRRRLDIGGVLALPSRADWRHARAALADVTHISVHTRFFPMTWLGLRLARERRIPSVLTEHGGGPVVTSSALVSRAAAVIDRTAGRRALRRADVLLAISATSAGFVRRLAGREAQVLGNGTDAAFWAGDTRAARPHVVFAGRLVREKGWSDFLAIFSRLERDVTGTLAGGGADLSRVRELVARDGLADRLTVTGPLDRTALRAAFSGSVYVNPSHAAEGFQTTLLEAGLAGARIATYDVGGADEVVGSGGAAGRVVPRGDVAALTGATQGLLAEPRPAPAPDALLAYDWPAVADRYLALATSGHR